MGNKYFYLNFHPNYYFLMHRTHTAGELFAQWNIQKQEINMLEHTSLFREGEIWWCSFGKNIWVEEDGKNELFERPVIVLRKFNNEQFFWLPLTSKNRDDQYHFPSDTTWVVGSIILSQWRVMSSKRLSRKIATIARGKFKLIRNRFSQLFSP